MKFYGEDFCLIYSCIFFDQITSKLAVDLRKPQIFNTDNPSQAV